MGRVVVLVHAVGDDTVNVVDVHTAEHAIADGYIVANGNAVVADHAANVHTVVIGDFVMHKSSSSAISPHRSCSTHSHCSGKETRKPKITGGFKKPSTRISCSVCCQCIEGAGADLPGRQVQGGKSEASADCIPQELLPTLCISCITTLSKVVA